MNRLRHLETFARAGWCARGVVYCLLAAFALTGAGASDASPQGVFRSVRDMPGGSDGRTAECELQIKTLAVPTATCR